MSSRDKDNKTFQDKFRQFFRRNQGSRSRGSFELSDDILRDIGKETPTHQRIKRLRDLNERVSCSNLDTVEESSGDSKQFNEFCKNLNFTNQSSNEEMFKLINEIIFSFV